MASFIFNKAVENAAKGNIDYDTDTFYVMLTTSAYAPNKDTDDYRNDVTNEVAGAGYVAGGNAVAVSVNLDTVNDRVDITLGGTTWPASTLTARRAVYYKHRGGASSADEVVAQIDFGTDVITSSGTFTLTASTIRYTNT